MWPWLVLGLRSEIDHGKEPRPAGAHGDPGEGEREPAP
jgi:hypothetical protein